ncbi:CBS domain-containing protein [Agromyces sp. M3QZ16-3]|uniref:CBS domain-containing protein n=1 Tax=Agromyces sp. M3QZ16-3 TaxID=3447585 RepID=UPI003F68C37E
MTLARDLMTPDPAYVTETQSVAHAARILRDLDIGSLPVCGDEELLRGVLTEHEIVTTCVAEGADPNEIRVGELACGTPATIGVDRDIREAIGMMHQRRIRTLHVVDGRRLVGVITLADVTRRMADDDSGEDVAHGPAT